MNSDPQISIIIPAYNAEKTLKKAVNGALSQQNIPDFEVIVVDDGSNDKTSSVARTFDRVRCLRQPNAGPASARNAGARLARGKILLFTDADCVPAPDWAQQLIRHFEDPAVGAVAGTYGIANPENALARAVQAEISYRHARMPDRVKVFGSYSAALRRADFEKAGGFCEDYSCASGEDNDLSYKVRAGGVAIAFARRARVDHYHPESVARYLREQYRHGYWRASLYRRHPVMMTGDDYTFWKDLIEVPLSLIIFAALFAAAAGSSAGAFLFGLFLGVLTVIELAFSWRILAAEPFRIRAFFAGVMLARAVVRTAGFLLGWLRNAIFNHKITI